MIKRFIDFTISLAGLIIFLPLLFLIWLVIKVSTRGPAFVKDERIGKDQKLIYLYHFNKYRNHDRADSIRSKVRRNTDFTPVGKFLQVFGLDGLPLFFNIFKGDLSFVGPQPERKEFIKFYSKEQKQVFTMRPGIFCPYIHFGDRDNLPDPKGKVRSKKQYRNEIFPEKVKAELNYIQDRGLGRDIWVLLNYLKMKIERVIDNQLVKEAQSRNYFLPLDVALVLGSYFLAYQLRFDWNVPEQEYLIFIKCFGIVLFIRIVTFYLFGIYRNLWKYVGVSDLLSIIFACTVSSVISISGIFFLGMQAHSRSIFLIDWFLCIFLIGGSRLAVRLLKENNGLERKVKKNVLIIGAGDLGNMALQMLHLDKQNHNNVIGFVDNDNSVRHKTLHGITVLGGYQDIPQLIAIYRVDEVLIAVPELSSEDMKIILTYCKEAKARHRIVPAVNDMLSGSYHLSKFREIEISDLFGRQPVKLDLSAIQAFIHNKRILVTGAGGSIGSELCRQIAEYNPASIILVDKNENYLHEIRSELEAQYDSFLIFCHLCNITNRLKMQKIFEEYNPEIIFHAAANKHVPLSEENPEEAIWNNVYGTKQLAELADEYGVQVFVMVSTDKAVNPTSIMGVTKRIAELYVQACSAKSRTKFVTVRFGNVLNSNGSVIPIFKRQIEKGGPVTITHPDVKRFFMSISEAVQLILQVTTMGRSGEIFILEMGKSIRIMDIAIELIQQYGFKPYEDIPIKLIGLRPGEKLDEELVGKNEEWVPTKHANVKILKSKYPIDFTLIERELDNLINFTSFDDREMLNKTIGEIVPEYVPFSEYSGNHKNKKNKNHNGVFKFPLDIDNDLPTIEP